MAQIALRTGWTSYMIEQEPEWMINQQIEIMKEEHEEYKKNK